MFYPPRRIPITILTLLGVLTAGFLFSGFAPHDTIRLFGLIPARVLRDFWIWQMVTYMALHGGLLHLLFNMLTLYLFGVPLAALWGESKFIRYFLYCGIGAAVTTLIVMHESSIPTIGASGAIYGLLYAWAREFPDSVIYLYGLFPMRAKHFVIFMAALELILSQTPSPIARFAHLGGLAAGWLYFRMPDVLKWPRLPSIRKVRWEREITQEDVDRVLEKISRKGMDSLTAGERKILKEASKRGQGGNA